MELRGGQRRGCVLRPLGWLAPAGDRGTHGRGSHGSVLRPQFVSSGVCPELRKVTREEAVRAVLKLFVCELRSGFEIAGKIA